MQVFYSYTIRSVCTPSFDEPPTLSRRENLYTTYRQRCFLINPRRFCGPKEPKSWGTIRTSVYLEPATTKAIVPAKAVVAGCRGLRKPGAARWPRMRIRRIADPHRSASPRAHSLPAELWSGGPLSRPETSQSPRDRPCRCDLLGASG